MHRTKNTRKSCPEKITPKSWESRVGRLTDVHDDNGDHPLWRKESIQDRMNIILEVSGESKQTVNEQVQS